MGQIGNYLEFSLHQILLKLYLHFIFNTDIMYCDRELREKYFQKFLMMKM